MTTGRAATGWTATGWRDRADGDRADGGPSPDGAGFSQEELELFGAELAKTLQTRHKTADGAARRLGVPAEVVNRWVSGQDLPSESQARSLDEYLVARGAIQNLVIELRGNPDRPDRRPTLLQIFRGAVRALRASLIKDADGRPVGWPRDLRVVSAQATPTSTAYGIRTLLLLEDGLAADLVPLVESLRTMAEPHGGYAGRDQTGPRPEVTAAVVSALRRIAATEEFDADIAQMERDLGEFERFRPFILTIMLEASLLLPPDTELIDTLVDSLLAARRPYDGALLWPEKAEPLLIDPVPSVAHTARAVRALTRAQAIRPAARLEEAVQQAVAWLIGRRDLHNVSEQVERSVDGVPESVFVRHFTAAWVVKALVSAGVPATHPAVSTAVAQIWTSYGGETAGLWAWDNGDLPIWMTFDAVEALRMASLAVPGPPQFPLMPGESAGRHDE